MIVGFVCYLDLWDLDFADSRDRPKSNRSIDSVPRFNDYRPHIIFRIQIPEIPKYDSCCNIILEF